MSMQQIMFASLASGGDFVIEGSGLFNGTNGLLRFEPSSVETSLVTGCVEFIVKHTELGTQQVLLTGQSSNATYSLIQFNSSDQLDFQIRSSATNRTHLVTTQVFRDPSAWMFIRVFYDSTPASPSSSDIGIEINGTQVTDFATETYSVQNWPWQFTDNAMKQTIGAFFDSADASSGPVNHFGGYMARALVLDGTKGTSNQAAEVTDDGFWQINDASGLDFGNNGFLLTGQNVSTGTDSSLVALADRPTPTASASSSQYTGATGSVTFSGDDLTAFAHTKSIRSVDTFTGDFEISFTPGAYPAYGRFGIMAISYDSDFDENEQAGAWSIPEVGDGVLVDNNNGYVYWDGVAGGVGYGDQNGVVVKFVRKGGVISMYHNGVWKVSHSGHTAEMRFHFSAAISGTTTFSNISWTDWATTGIPNDFTPTGSIISTSDSPTNSDDGYGNYNTQNPLATKSLITLSDGNRVALYSGVTWQNSFGTMLITSGKWYWEVTITTAGASDNGQIGITKPDYNWAGTTPFSSTATGYSYYSSGTKVTSNSGSSYGDAFVVTDVIGVAYDADNGILWFSNEGVWQNSATIGEVEASTSTNAAFTGITGDKLPAIAGYNGCKHTTNYGAEAYVNTQPTGYKSLATQNLPTPAVINYEDEYYIEAGISHSNGATTAVTLPTSVSGGAMARIKRTDSAGDWYVVNTVRGANSFVKWNDSAAEDTSTFTDDNLTGTTLTLASALATGTYVIEVFYVGSYFQIGTVYTGNLTNRTVAYPGTLDTAPGLSVVFGLTNAVNPRVQHIGMAATEFLNANLTSAKATAADLWNSTYASTTALSLGAGTAANGTSKDYISFHWANSGPFSFGIYTSNANVDGPNISLNGHPETLMRKRVAAAGSWSHISSVYGGGNPAQTYMYQNTTAATATAEATDLNSNGAKSRIGNTGSNYLTQEYIYGAFGIQPLTDSAVNQGRAR